MPDGDEYVIGLAEGKPTPAPWVNVLANPDFGTLGFRKRPGVYLDRKRPRIPPDAMGKRSRCRIPPEKLFISAMTKPGNTGLRRRCRAAVAVITGPATVLATAYLSISKTAFTLKCGCTVALDAPVKVYRFKDS